VLAGRPPGRQIYGSAIPPEATKPHGSFRLRMSTTTTQSMPATGVTQRKKENPAKQPTAPRAAASGVESVITHPWVGLVVAATIVPVTAWMISLAIQKWRTGESGRILALIKGNHSGPRGGELRIHHFPRDFMYKLLWPVRNVSLSWKRRTRRYAPRSPSWSER
jgi:hypothetical protein